RRRAISSRAAASSSESEKNVRTTTRGGTSCASAVNISVNGMARTKSATGGASARSGATACSPSSSGPACTSSASSSGSPTSSGGTNGSGGASRTLAITDSSSAAASASATKSERVSGVAGSARHPARVRVHRVQSVVEAGDDAEVAAAPADRPEEIRMAVAVDLEDAAVGGDDLGAEQVVDRQTVLAREVAGTAADRQPADPDGRRVAEADREPMRCGGLCDLTRREAARCVRDALTGIDLEGGKAGQVEHDPALARAVAGEAVAAAADGELESGLAR